MSIIVSKQGKDAQKVERTVIQLENYLQEYVAANPNTLPLHEIDENIKLLVLAREFPTGSGPIDALGIDEQGSMYIIETKLYKNADKRTVIAQMLDYGASLWSNYGEPSEFITALDEAVNKRFNIGLSEKLQEFYGIEAEAVAVILERVKQNMRDGRFRFVVLMDKLDKRLKDLIKFVNQNSRFDILGVEWNFYQHEEFEVLIPSLYGAEVKKEVGATIKSGNAKVKWNRETFLDNARQQLNENEFAAVQSLYEFSNSNGMVKWGAGQTAGFAVTLPSISDKRLYYLGADSTLTLSFGWHSETNKSAYIEQFGQALRNMGFNLEDDYMQRSYLSFAASEWIPKLGELTTILKDLIASADAPQVSG